MDAANATLRFGRTCITPAISRFVKRYPKVEIQLQLTDYPLSLVDGAFEIGIRFGEQRNTQDVISIQDEWMKAQGCI